MKNDSHGLAGNVVYILQEGMARYRGKVLLMSLFMVFVDLYLSLYFSILSKVVLDAFMQGRDVIYSCCVSGVTFALAIVCSGLAKLLEGRFDRIQTCITNVFLEKRIHKAMTIHYELLERREILDMMNRAENATLGGKNCVRVVVDCFLKIVSHGIVIVTSVYLFTLAGYVVPFILVVTSLLHFLITDCYKRTDKRKVRDLLPPIDRKQGYLERISIQYAFGKEIRFFSLSDWISGKLQTVHGERVNMNRKSQNYRFMGALCNGLIILIQQILVYMILVKQLMTGQIHIGDFSMYIGLCGVVYGSLTGVFDQVAELRNTSRLVDDYRNFIELADDSGDIRQEQAYRAENGGKEPANAGKDGRKEIADEVQAGGQEKELLRRTEDIRIEFRNVSFKYPGSDMYALKNINLCIASGTRLAVVGSNGAGKSTFVKLICGLYTPTEGEILLNDRNIREFSKENYYQLFSPVFQNINIYPFSVAENIALGQRSPFAGTPGKPERAGIAERGEFCETYDEERVKNCLEQVQLGDRTGQMPRGIRTELTRIFTDEGEELSGGERQKLALARAIYKDGRIVMLDEPTSALDALAEKALYEDFDRMIQDKTAVFVSHRLSSTRFCDEILFFEHGEIVERGSHDELVRRGGRYAEMYEKQACYYR